MKIDYITKHVPIIERLKDRFGEVVLCGSFVLKSFGLIEREPNDIDIIVKHCNLQAIKTLDFGEWVTTIHKPFTMGGIKIDVSTVSDFDKIDKKFSEIWLCDYQEPSQIVWSMQQALDRGLTATPEKRMIDLNHILRNEVFNTFYHTEVEDMTKR